MKSENANQLLGMATGVVIMVFFGAVWFSMALVQEGMFGSGNPAVRICLLLPTLCLFLIAIWLFRQVRRFPSAQAMPSLRRKLFLIIFVTYSLYGVAAFILQRLHLDVYIVSVLAIFVGAHFLPEGKLLGNRPMMATGVVMIFWAMAAMFSLPAAHLASVTAVGCGLILWHSATITIAAAMDGLRRRIPAQVSLAQ